MTANDLLAKALESSLGMLKSTVSDFSDADMLTRPVPNANHPNWQLGHLIIAETSMLSSIGAKMPALPPDFNPRYTDETAKSDDPKKFLTKDQLIAQLETTRAASVAFVKSLTPEKLAAPVPGEMGKYFPTVAQLVGMTADHNAMHMGQIQVTRRKLNKPILF